MKSGMTTEIPYRWADDVVLGAVAGSQAQGLATATSDYDYLGVYVASTEDVLGLRGHQVVEGTRVSNNPVDVQVHEVAKFLGLALKANPTILELLWTDDRWIKCCTEAGYMLLGLREAVLSAKAVENAFVGYSRSQLKRAEKAGKVSKNRNQGKAARHCLRLLWQAETLKRDGWLPVDVSDRREHLFEMGELAVNDFDRFGEHYRTELNRIDRIRSVLPNEPDREQVNRTLLDIRYQNL